MFLLLSKESDFFLFLMIFSCILRLVYQLNKQMICLKISTSYQLSFKQLLILFKRCNRPQEEVDQSLLQIQKKKVKLSFYLITFGVIVTKFIVKLGDTYGAWSQFEQRHETLAVITTGEINFLYDSETMFDNQKSLGNILFLSF